MKTIPSPLKCLRFKRGLTQYDLAKAVQIDQTTLSLIERQFKTPSIKHVERLCSYFKLPKQDLFPEKVEEAAV